MSPTDRGRACGPQVERFLDRVSRLDRALEEAATAYGAPARTPRRAPRPAPGVPGQGRRTRASPNGPTSSCLPGGPTRALVGAVPHRRGGTARDRVPTHRQRCRSPRSIGGPGADHECCTSRGARAPSRTGTARLRHGPARRSGPRAVVRPSTRPPAVGRGVGRRRVRRRRRRGSIGLVTTGVDADRLGSQRRRVQAHPPPPWSRRRPGRDSAPGTTTVPVAPMIDPMLALMDPRRRRRGQALLRPLRRRGRTGPRRRTGPDQGLLPEVPHAVRLRSQAGAGDAARRPVRGRGLPRPRRHGLDLPRPRPQRERPLGGAQGPAQHRRPRRLPGRGRREAVPGRGRASADRRDLQLRDRCRRQLLHRHGVRRRQVPQHHPQGP